MSGSTPAPRRPATARPRTDAPPGMAEPTSAELVAIEEQLARLAEHSGATVRRPAGLAVVLASMPGAGPGLNYAALVRWPAADVARRLAQLSSVMLDDGAWPTLVVADGLSQPDDLAERLADAGWLELAAERVHLVRHPPEVPHLSPSLRVEAVTRRSAEECARLEAEAFGLADSPVEERAEHLARGLEAGALRAFLVRHDGAAVACARLLRGQRVAGLYGIGVVPTRRRRGYGTLVTAIATRAGLAFGNRLVWLSVDEANAPAIGLYRKLGYAPAFRWSRWVAPAG
ncbi:MAG TPA: GNAT family N-acetyltransferase [Candidatus Limnocylindria bacterium]|nr:GNAT family N-acetyltransferase [Candidatus Limnocylindria bacterium]